MSYRRVGTLALVLVVSACNGADGSRSDGAAGSGGGGGGGAGGSGDGSAGSGGGGAGGSTGGAGGNAACGSVVDQASCSSEGTVCASPCPDACSFCNSFRCVGGRWQRMESFPAPCFGCGPIRCQNNAQYCREFAPGIPTGSVTYSCEEVPSACRPTPTCDCLEPLVAGEVACSQSSAGQLTIFLAAP